MEPDGTNGTSGYDFICSGGTEAASSLILLQEICISAHLVANLIIRCVIGAQGDTPWTFDFNHRECCQDCFNSELLELELE